MHKESAIILVCALFASTVLASTNAFAYHKVSISGPVSRGQLLKDCAAVGGLCGNCKGGSGAYSCTNTNNPGGETIVQCTSGGKCTGYVPRKNNPSHTIGGILHPPPAGIKSSGGSASPKGHHPVRISGFKPPSHIKQSSGKSSPVTITHAGHSGGGHK